MPNDLLDPPEAVVGAEPEPAEATVRQIRELPKEVGLMLVSVGALGMVLPGMMGTPALIAGGLVLWPKAFGRVEDWFGRRHPKAHRQGLRQVGRFLADLERRYPAASGGEPP